MIVASVRALKYQGGADAKQLSVEDLPRLEAGIATLERHIDNMTREFGLPCVVALNHFVHDTAAEVAGGPVSGSDLEGPGRNAELGARYLKGLLGQFQGNPLTAVAGYNAGPGAVQGWLSPRLGAAPELWVEAIPFPETRLYVKKVLGNAWSYQERPQPGGC